MDSEVFVNGKSLGVRPYGYSSFSYDLSLLCMPVLIRVSLFATARNIVVEFCYIDWFEQ
jgi:hypothetical protein